MKRLLLFAFTLLLSLSVSGQKNEIIYSYHFFNTESFKENTFGYYRNFPSHHAVGLKANFNWDVIINDAYERELYIGQMDLVYRINFLKRTRFRLLSEFGMSVKRAIYHYKDLINYIRPPMTPSRNSQRKNFLGMTTGIGFDYQVFKAIKMGAAFGIKKYFNNEFSPLKEDFESKWNSSFNLNLGLNF